MSPIGQIELLRLLSSPRAEDRATLLRFASEAPLVYGSWGDWKWLYKQAEARLDPELLGALISRLDAAPFPVSGPDLLQTNPARIENVVSQAVASPYVYALIGGSGERDNIRAYDLSDPTEFGSVNVRGAVA